eukprot:456368_1
MEMLFYILLMLISNINAAAPPSTTSTSPPGAVNGGKITCGVSIDANIPTQGDSISVDENDNEVDGMYAKGVINVTGGQMNNNGKELVRLKSNESVEGGNNVVQMTIGNDDSDDEMYQTELNQTAGQ